MCCQNNCAEISVVRDVLMNAGCPVKKLTQVRLGPLELKGVALSQWRELTRDEVRALRQVLSAARRGTIGSAPGGTAARTGKPGADSEQRHEARDSGDSDFEE